MTDSVSGSTAPKIMSFNVSHSVAFAVGLLVEDGLRVPPFDQHPERQGPLSEAGLTPDMWRKWLLEMIDNEAAMNMWLAHHSENIAPGSELRGLDGDPIPPPYDPAAALPGDAYLGELLDARWQRWRQDVAPHLEAEWDARSDAARQWTESRVLILVVDCVDYPTPVVHVAPPTHLIIGTPSMTAEDTAPLVREGLRLLSVSQ